MPGATIANTLGAMQIGTAVAVFLFGAITLQFDAYMASFMQDRWQMKLLILGLWLLELVHTICICAETWSGTIAFYGNFAGYTDRGYPFMGTATLVGGMITMIVQCFFCGRLWLALSNSARWVGAVCGCASILRGIGSIYLGCRCITANTMEEYRDNNAWLIRTLLASGTAIDIIISASMLYFLLKKRRKGVDPSARLIDRLVGYTIRSGLMTSVTAIVVLATFQSRPETLIWVGAYVVLAKLYTNSLFSYLNERRQLRDFLASSSLDHNSKIRDRFSRSGFRQSRRQTVGPTITIEMSTTVICDTDELQENKESGCFKQAKDTQSDESHGSSLTHSPNRETPMRVTTPSVPPNLLV